MTSNDLQGHALSASLLKCDFSYSCAAADKISRQHVAWPPFTRAELLVLTNTNNQRIVRSTILSLWNSGTAVQMCMYCRGREVTAMSSDWHTGQELAAVWRQRCTPLPRISTRPSTLQTDRPPDQSDRPATLLARRQSSLAVGICSPPNVNYIYRRLQRSIPLLYSTTTMMYTAATYTITLTNQHPSIFTYTRATEFILWLVSHTMQLL